MKSTNLAVVGVILLVLAFVSCSESPPYKNETTINNIDRIFKHEPRAFSFHIRVNEKEAIPTEIYVAAHVRIIYDVKVDKLMWARYTKEESSSGYLTTTLIIHAHSPDNIGGGGWSHGKFGRGQTNVVQ